MPTTEEKVNWQLLTKQATDKTDRVYANQPSDRALLQTRSIRNAGYG